jgi:hypothetical protein
LLRFDTNRKLRLANAPRGSASSHDTILSVDRRHTVLQAQMLARVRPKHPMLPAIFIANLV